MEKIVNDNYVIMKSGDTVRIRHVSQIKEIRIKPQIDIDPNSDALLDISVFLDNDELEFGYQFINNTRHHPNWSANGKNWEVLGFSSSLEKHLNDCIAKCVELNAF